MRKFRITSLLVTAVLLFASCSSDDTPQPGPQGDYVNGYFVTNEGPFNNGTGTITFVGDDGNLNQHIFKTVNNEDLGNVVQSMYIAKDNAYIIVNNSNKIVVANRYTFKKLGVITEDIRNPRYMVAQNGVGYISNWGDALDPTDDFIAVINLNNNKVVRTIPVGEGPEKMLVIKDKLFVNLKGGWNHNDKVAMIDLLSDEVKEEISVGDMPNSIVDDGKGNVLVLSGGITWPAASESAGKLVKFSSATGSVISEYEFEKNEHPNFLNMDNGKLYYNLNGKVYVTNNSAILQPGDEVNGIDGFFYSMTIYGGDLYATDAKDFASEGELKVFNIAGGNLVETYTTGIIPGSVVFQN